MTRMSTIPQTLSRAMTTQDSAALRYTRLLLLLALFAIGLGIRLVGANEPPLNFHAMRQYRSLLIARGYYVETAKFIPEWERQVTRISKQRQGILEPPVTEVLVAAGYRLTGGERLWLPRVLSSLFWLIGGGFLYMIAKRIADADTAMVSMAFYLFLPFAVVASRSFQPDPLMIMLLLAGVWAILRFYERPSRFRLAMAAIISAFAFFVKPGGVFMVIAAFIALSISQQGIRRGIINKAFLLFLVITVVPAVTFYAYGTITGEFLVVEAETTLLPHLLLTPFFWRGWLGNISIVVGYAAFFSGLLGVLLLHSGMPRALLIGMWAGYLAFCLTFNYNVATHDYYQLQLIPIVALSLAPLVALAVQHAVAINTLWYWRVALAGIILLALTLGLGSSYMRLAGPNTDRTIEIAEEIGEQVEHGTQTIFLTSDYGVSLEYHGKLSGWPWPLASDLEWERLAGLPVLPADERFEAWFAAEAPDYFIVADMREFEAQADLKHFLFTNFLIVAQNPDYLIFDLRDE